MSPRAIGLLVLAVAAGGCSPIGPDPELRGPADVRYERAGDEGAADADANAPIDQLVWVNEGRVITITAGTKLCQESAWSSGCIRISAADRKQLNEFFSDATFRKRWDSYHPCPARIGRSDDSEIFVVQYADGKKIGRALDAPMGAPETRQCDRSARAAVVAIEAELVRRYLR